MRSVSKAFVLAGGTGTRLRPITLEIPKPMLPVKGIPILEFNLRNLIEFGAKEIVIGAGKNSSAIQEYFGKKFLNAKIRHCIEKKPLGTAGALKNAEKHFKKTFFMCNGDEIKDVDYKKMLALHSEKKAMATIALKKVKNPKGLGIVKTKNTQITSFSEKPKKTTDSGIVNAGAYILEPRVLKMIPANKKYSLEKQLFPKLAEKKELHGCKCVGQWLPTDTFERYENAIKKTRFMRRWFNA